MANRTSTRVKIWFDPQGDYLEVLCSDRPGFLRETGNVSVMERVDTEGNLLGFSIMDVSRLKKGKPIIADLVSPLIPPISART